jgi:hypothetical protein
MGLYITFLWELHCQVSRESCGRFYSDAYISSIHNVFHHSLVSVVGIATGHGLDDRGITVRVPVGSRIFCSPRCPDRQPSIQWVPGAVSLGGKAAKA